MALQTFSLFLAFSLAFAGLTKKNAQLVLKYPCLLSVETFNKVYVFLTSKA